MHAQKNASNMMVYKREGARHHKEKKIEDDERLHNIELKRIKDKRDVIIQLHNQGNSKQIKT